MSVLSDFPQVGDMFLGRYRIESILGSGGFARVYRATQTDLDRDVAIKVMRPAIEREDSTEETIAQIEQVEKRFRREAKVISKFRSPNTVVVHDYGRTDGGLLYMTLEFVDGETLSRIIKRDAPLDPRRAVGLVRQVLDSLYEAHAFDVLHRDIKPQNVMVFSHLDQHDLVKVLDFGIAKVLEVDEEAAAVQELTTDGTLIGTPRYMSPEQIRGDRLSPASDLYSLGLVLYEALTGVKAVAEKTTMRIIAVHLDPRPIEFPPNKALGKGMRAILERLLAKEPEDRFQSAKEVLAAFDAWDPDEPLEVPKRPGPPKLPSIPRPPIRERQATPTIGATLAPSYDSDSEADRAPTVVVEVDDIDTDPDLGTPEHEAETPAEAEASAFAADTVTATQRLTAEEIEEASREDRLPSIEPEALADDIESNQEPDASDEVAPLVAPLQQLGTQVDDDDTLNKPGALATAPLLWIVGIAAVVLVVGIVVIVAATGGGDDAVAKEPAEDAVTSAVASDHDHDDDKVVAEHAELDQPEPEVITEPVEDEPEVVAVGSKSPENAAPLAPDLGQLEREPEESDEPAVEDEPAEAKTPTRKPRKRNKLWSLE